MTEEKKWFFEMEAWKVETPMDDDNNSSFKMFHLQHHSYPFQY
jgi:hypothetical protein